MNETLHIEDLTFDVRRSSRRKTIGITVEREGELSVAAPTGTRFSTIENTVRGKLFWVYLKLAEKSLLFQPRGKRKYVSGEGFHYLGRSYRLLLVDGRDSPPKNRILLVHGRFRLASESKPRAAELFKRWYSDHALAWINRRVEDLAPHIGENPKAVQVRDLGNRWGSCTSDKTVNFHWRTICLPPTLVEYVIAHELVHLHESGHTKAFWSRLERVMPDYADRKRRLAEQGGQYS